MRISVIIPSYNQAEYLADAIESAYNQTTPAHEIIVVDDGSTDGSLEIARRYEFKKYPLVESPVRVISQVNKGLASARNTGIMNATGDYCFFLDADDVMLENCLERLAQESANSDIVAPSFKNFGKYNNDMILGAFTIGDMMTANRLPYFCLVKRSALLEVGGYNPKMRHGYEDYDLWFDLLKRGKSVMVLQEKLMLYRTKENSMLTDAYNNHHVELMEQIKLNHPEIWPK